VTDRADESDAVDRVLAEHLARGGDADRAGSELPLTPVENDDLLRRLSALDFIDAVVGSSPIPERIGDYRITNLLGRGGMGTVYGAFQESLEREVALKVLSPALSADPVMRRRFRIEARATAALHHQHIVPIYDFGEVGGLLYFAMERIDGVSLDQHIARARRAGQTLFAPREAARRFAGVADALAHAHRRRILHRDVKPANLLVHRDGTLALADFGLSRVLGEASVRSSGRGGFLGTLQYASPEQARSDRLTPASDLYSLGVTMFEAVSGQLPFRAETPEAVLDALLNQEPRSLRNVRPDVPHDLAAVVAKLLRKEAVDRYPDGEALARDLWRVADGEPVYVRRQPLIVRIWRRVRRRPGLSAALAAAALLGLTSVYALTTRAIDMHSNRLASYQSLVGEAVRTLADDAGPLSGPGDLFAVLSGVGREVDRADTVYAAIERARSFAPELGDAAALQAAFEAPGDVEAETHLRAGRGLTAKRLLDEHIREAVRQLATPTPSGRVVPNQPLDQIRWYRLFVARAVACLTASVGDPGQARIDLHVASLFRGGAYAPRVLAAIAELAFTPDVEAVVRDLEALVRAGPPGGGRIALELIEAAAGEERRKGVQLMRLPLTRGERSRLLASAYARLGGIEATSDATRWSGLEGELAAVAERALHAPERAGDALRDAQRRLGEEVDARAPLQSWAVVFDLLQPGGAPAERGTVPLERRLRGYLDFLSLEPPRELVAGRARVLLAAADEAEGSGQGAMAAELRARLQLILDPAAARVPVEAWVAQALDDPDAYLARFECCVLASQFMEARDAATNSVARALHRDLQLRRVLARLQAAASDESQPHAAAWQVIYSQFEPLL